MHYLTKQFERLDDEDKAAVLEELIDSGFKLPATKTDQIKLSLMADFTEDAKILDQNWGKVMGLSTGYPSLDNLTKGLVGGELIIVAGKTSYGKTTLAINIANHVALAGTPVMFVSLEMTKPQIASRYMHINGGETEDYFQVAATTAFQANDELSWKAVDPLIKHAVDDIGAGLIVIDHLHYFSRETTQLAEDLGRITKEFKKNAIRYNLPVILISHVRRTGKDEEATVDDLRGSSYIGQDADVILMVGRKPSEPENLHVKIEKNRNRGYDFHNDTVTLALDGIKITEKETPAWNTSAPFYKE